MKRSVLVLSLALMGMGALVSCSDDVGTVGKPAITEFQLLSSQNPERLISDVRCEIYGDSLIEGWIPHLTKDKFLKPHFQSTGTVTLYSTSVVSDQTTIDFCEPVTLQVSDEGISKLYKVIIHSYTGLPVCTIETENRQEIAWKDEYVNAHMTIQKDVVTRAVNDFFETDMQIKGRGNSTWSLPKKPYRIKLDSKKSILDMPQGKSWVLLANYADKSMIRNKIAEYLGSLSRLDYTPRSHFVEVWLNGKYDGTYQFSEKVSVSKNRVDIGDDGFLLEIDAYASGESDAKYFYTSRLPQPVNIKEPKVEFSDSKYKQAKDFVTEAETALYGSNFKDPEKGWRKYFDEVALVDWYVINEIVKNWDAIRWSSTYMTYIPGGKIAFGPLWDFDIAYGNAGGSDGCDGRQEGFQIKEQAWFSRFFEDPYFVKLVKERYDYFYSKKSAIMQEINDNANYLKLSAVENDNRWHTLYTKTWRNRDIWGSYYNEIEQLKEWLDNRMDWLKDAYDNM